MAFPRRLLHEDEEISLDLRPHWWFFSRNVLTGVPLFAVFVLTLSVTTGDVRRVVLIAWAAVALVWAGWLGIQYLNWHFTQFVVTNKRVMYRTGVLSKRGTEIPLERITNINFSQRIWERIIGAGDLDIESAGAQGTSHFENVNQPDAVSLEINRQREENARLQARWATAADAAVAPGAAASDAGATDARAAAPSAAERIRELAALRDQGLISDDEFETQKARLLETM